MSYSASITQRSFISSRRQESALVKSRSLIVFLLALLIILFSILYIIQANSVATRGYTIQKHKSEVVKLQSESKNLELRLSEIRSLGFLEEKIKSLNMVKIGKVEYLLPISQVAAR